MKLSTRARYGLRVCFLLGVHGGLVPLSELGQETGVSQKYLEQLLAMLRRAGIVSTLRGTTGGYRLSRAPDGITVKEVLEAVDDGFAFTDCTVGTCEDGYCPNRRLFRRLYDDIDRTLSSTTVQTMIDDYQCVRN